MEDSAYYIVTITSNPPNYHIAAIPLWPSYPFLLENIQRMQNYKISRYSTIYYISLIIRPEKVYTYMVYKCNYSYTYTYICI